MKIEIEINTDNAAFEYHREGEISRILKAVTQSIVAGKLYGSIRDSNGNTVGKFDVSESDS